MSSKRNRSEGRSGSSRSAGSSTGRAVRAAGGSAGRDPGAAGRLQPARAARRGPNRRRQFLAAGVVAVALLVTVAFVFITQAKEPSVGALAPDRHALGKASAPVTITEWSDFQ